MGRESRGFMVLCVLCALMLSLVGTAFAGNSLRVGQALHPGDMLTSKNGRYKLTLQRDGNLVLYDRGKAIWAAGTQGKHAKKLLMQRDGNLVLYGPRGPLWASNTSGNRNSFLELQDDGNLVIYKAIWSTGTAR